MSEIPRPSEVRLALMTIDRSFSNCRVVIDNYMCNLETDNARLQGKVAELKKDLAGWEDASDEGLECRGFF